ncbi:N-acetyl-1-D-myo-inositol-2-amino-2-deoxy-alpha-D-glucopyranoside deacetylase [Gordonia amarae]|uniref:1D-myo-inositol 2-acetamido-2-deoxy-alpha-D-glucopyranoside deacetylase n=1 Tax=Gordonia amarae NBRC 15530 TaxID=1075090 RepID=G7GV96_9ACTN|nr:N-acetyl-1-D-myo-inositol-2-amino-2-deoxy-alpha-D-glucopyranoside deacetylase [Gordonia amarae]MCS3879967.1 N-acetyl-1-D-myo-inositol-2-amino-2-deoxy-alpha-D-glucopyranoside deacetylase [Gordonia amarae]GAB07521.1 N-acetyl-1-D-myo-Inosityl-2-amino-2-deoxy-alpha-D-glucopyranoside deacetylase MshB [Gordonia amarae NBRC 15530]
MSGAEGASVADSVTAGRRLLLVHAHPDDETIMTGGTIAKYLAEGAQVLVVTFTLGEEGEVIGDEWAQLVADGGADQLGGFRIFELTTALAALSPPGEPGRVLRPRFLGGAGHFRDSGMAGSPSAEHPRALAQAPFGEPVALLADILTEFAPQVVVTYDRDGTYGHPDHVMVHQVTAAALPIARERLGTDVKVYESVTEHSALESGLAAASGRVPEGWRPPHDGELPRYPDEVITAAVDVSSVYERKVAALAAHATQVTVAPSGTEYALSNNILTPIGAVEHFVQVDGPRPDVPGRETDLFAGLD